MSGGPNGSYGSAGPSSSARHPVQLLRRALDHHQQGQLEQAETLYRDVLAIMPQNADALHYLGVLESQRGHRDAGLSLIDRAIAANPRSAPAYYNRAGILRELARPEEALESYDRALGLNEKHIGALNNRGVVLHDLKRYGEAVASYDRVIAINSNHADAWANRGNSLAELGRPNEALESFGRSLAIAPDNAAAQFGRGNALASLDRLDDALASYDRALGLTPRDARILNNRGNVLARLNRHEEAAESFGQAIEADPRHPEAYKNRANLFIHLKRPAAALADYDQALALNPGHVDVLYGRAHAFSELKRDDEAIATYQQLLRYKPDHPYARGMLLYAKRNACDWRDHPELVAEVVESVRAGRRSITPLAFLGVSRSEQDNAQCARVLIQDKFMRASQPLWRGERYRHERIRLLYLSADFAAHAVTTQIAGVFERHDRSRFETIAISYGLDDGSEARTRLRRSFDTFLDMNESSDADIAARIRDMEADILVDLTGLTARSRPGVLARRPAGLQVQYLGYAGSLGADYVDYVIADETVIPEHNRAHYAEKVIWLPDSYMPTDCDRQIADRQPSRAEAGLPEDGFVFCAFNNVYKFSPETFDLWMRVLAAVPNSVLWLTAASEAAQRNLAREAELRGVARQRLVFAPYVTSNDDHLARLALADLFLDTLPYNAHASACDALWAGVPVLSQPGDTFAGRVGASLLRACGVPEMIVDSPASYEALALRLAREPSALSEVRSTLVRNRLSCALFDTTRFTRHLEAAYTTMWERHGRGQQPEPFSIPWLQA